MANGTSTIDYVLISSSIFSDISNFEVLPVTPYSIHSQLKFCLDIPNVTYPCAMAKLNNDVATPGKVLEPRIKYSIPSGNINAFSENFRSKLNENLDFLEENSQPTEMVSRLQNTFNQSAVKYESTYKPHQNLKN